MRVRDLVEDVAIAVVAGYAGTKAMEPVGMALYRREPSEDRAREDAVRPGAPYQVAANKITKALGFDLSEDAREKVGLGFHYGLAISWAPVYGLLRRRFHLATPVAALVTGVVMSVLVDETLTPLLGFSAPNRSYPLVTHLRGVVAHLVFGVAVGAVSETVWVLVGRSPVTSHPAAVPS